MSVKSDTQREEKKGGGEALEKSQQEKEESKKDKHGEREGSEWWGQVLAGG